MKLPSSRNLRRVAALALALAGLLAAGGARAQEPAAPLSSPAPAADPCAEERLAPLRARIEAARGLRFSGPVPCRVGTPETLARKLRTEWERRSPKEWEAVETRLHHFGLLPRDRSLESVLLPLLGQEIAAWYDYDEKALTLVRGRAGDPSADEGEVPGGGLLGAGAEAALEEITLLHELDHGLADQVIGLADAVARRRGQNDAENAFLAVLEGQATWTMTLALLGDAAAGFDELPPESIDGMLEAMESATALSMSGGAMAGAPPAIRESLLFPYLDGFRFAVRLYLRGGADLLARTLRNPPETSRSILHPDEWGGHPEEPVRFGWPKENPFLAAGWTLVEDETWGEQDLAVLLGKGTAGAGGEEAVGWRGDRFRIFRNAAGRTAAVGVTEWEDLPRAILFEAAIRERLERLHRERRAGRPASPRGLRSAGPVVSRRGTRVFVVDGAPWALAEQTTAMLLTVDSWVERCPALPPAAPAAPAPVD